eukprot:TRINITY_DN2583_c1_g1_i1.p1 TRINITY_DN2583_c1_g1~~TRINITY_DN2583_c1_g1_i1.p1  ORF type:complete len:599 (+),score=227.88 TRINITY_DN2583_c1_g1_i1:73-1797(+)
MPYVVFVASDVYGQKVNLELEFPYAPTLGELTAAVEAAFSAEQAARRPGHPPHYQVSKFHVVDESTDDWVEVVAASQLRNHCQMYSFQPHSTRYTEMQGHIPPAVKARSLYGGSPSRADVGPSPYTAAPSLPGGYSPAEPAYSVGRQLPADLPHDDRVRATFDEADTNRNRVIDQQEFTSAVQLCELEVSQATAADLFRKADVDQDGVLSYAEWQRWAELYPTLHDCFYHRFKLLLEHKAAEQRVEQAKQVRRQLEDREEAAKRQVRQADEGCEAAQHRAEEAERAAAAAGQRQRDADDALREQQRASDAARQQLADGQRRLADERERERQAQARGAESARELEGASRRQQQAEHAVAQADAAEQRALQALEEARREKERQQRIAAEAAADADRARARHEEILSAAPPQAMEEARRLLADAEDACREQDRKQRALSAALQDAARAAGDAARARDEAQRQVLASKDQKEPALRALTGTGRDLVDHDRQVKELSDETDRILQKGKELWAQENMIVEQEIRLREQRDQLEAKEEALRSAQSSFVQQAGRSPARARMSHSPGGAIGGAGGTPPGRHGW